MFANVKYEVDQLKNTVEELFPKVFRGGFIISLWSVFEACIKDIAEYVRRKKNIPFGLQDLRAGDFIEQTDKFFFRLLEVKAFPVKSVRTKLEELNDFLRRIGRVADGKEKQQAKEKFSAVSQDVPASGRA